jgi:hypothetical protein
MKDERLAKYAHMWTSEIARYGIVEFAPQAQAMGVIFDLEAWAPLVIDDEPEVLCELLNNLRRAGARRLTAKEARPR